MFLVKPAQEAFSVKRLHASIMYMNAFFLVLAIGDQLHAHFKTIELTLSSAFPSTYAKK